MAETALIVAVPEAEPFVAKLRQTFDPTAKEGTPAHITLLYPFLPPEALTEDSLDLVAAMAATFSAFSFILSEIRRFPDVVYLAPEPTAPFIALAHSLSKQFPTCLPYHGLHREVVPHLTVARAHALAHGHIEAALKARLDGRSIRARCEALHMIENGSGVWRIARSFPLAS